MTNGPEEPAPGDGASFTGSSPGISPPRRARLLEARASRAPHSAWACRRQAKRLGLEQSAADLLDGTSIDRLECERDALAAADAHGDDPAPEAVATHRMDEAGFHHPTGSPARSPVGERAALDIDAVGGKPEPPRDGGKDRGQGPDEFGAPVFAT